MQRRATAAARVAVSVIIVAASLVGLGAVGTWAETTLDRPELAAVPAREPHESVPQRTQATW
jgi:hypothetical protein